MILERETIAVELLLTKLAHQQLLSFTVSETASSRKIQWIYCSEKFDMTVDFSVLVAFIMLTRIRAHVCFSITFVRVWPLWKIAISCRTDTDTRNVGNF